MPSALVTGAIVTYKYDDDSEEMISIRQGYSEYIGGYVEIRSKSNDACFTFNSETWPLIRDEVGRLFEQIEHEQYQKSQFDEPDVGERE